MQISLLLGAAMTATAGAMAAKFRPRARGGRLLCVLLAVMGLVTLALEPADGTVLLIELVLAGVMAGCTAGVLALEERCREKRRAACREAARLAKEAGRRSLRLTLRYARVTARYFQDDCPAA